MKTLLLTLSLLLLMTLSSGSVALAAEPVVIEFVAEEGSNSYREIEKARAEMRSRVENSLKERELFSANGAREDEKNPFVSMIQGLMLCLGLFALLVFIIKKTHRITRGANEGRMHVIERIPLSQKTFLHLVEVDGKEFLVGSGPDQVSLLSLREATPLSTRPLPAKTVAQDGTIELREAV